MIIVEATGVQSLIQDEGRPGLASIGVTRSGSFDREAAELANRLVGNATSAAVIETIGGGLRLRTDQDILVAVTGAVGDVMVSGRRCSRNTGLQLSAHDTVEVAPTSWGVRTYVAVDGGMSDNPRPVLYGSGYETFLPRAVAAERPRTVTLVGKHCESGDKLVVDGAVPADLAVGDVIATPVTGAYGHSMGSNYNKVLRPPVVFVADGQARLVVRRETMDDLLATDVG